MKGLVLEEVDVARVSRPDCKRYLPQYKMTGTTSQTAGPPSTGEGGLDVGQITIGRRPPGPD